MSVSIASHFDGGAIEVISAVSSANVRLRIASDSRSTVRQWFYFRVSGVRGELLTLSLDNAGDCTYTAGWSDYKVVASYDGENWFRVPTQFDGRALRVRLEAKFDHIYFAYFEPYSEVRRAKFLGTLQTLPGVCVRDLCRSINGKPISLVRVSDGQRTSKKKLWFIARQHSGEAMAEWFVEGLLQRLTRQGCWEGDPIARDLLSRADILVVPNMNPDGSALGNLRMNAAGIDLNRQWSDPNAISSPEVLYVREEIMSTGCDAFFDVHGDEALPYVFAAGTETVSGSDQDRAREQETFVNHLKNATSEFQNEFGYATNKHEKDNLQLAARFIGHHFGCLAMTLEMPFKDNANCPDERTGWNGARSRALGAAMLQALYWQLCQR